MVPDFEFYRDVYKGWKLSREEFEGWAAQAAGVLGRYCRIYAVTPAAALLERYAPEQLYQLAACGMADVLAFYDKAASLQESQSATVGSVSYSTTKGQSGCVSLARQNSDLLAAAGRYLDIYRGVA